MVSYTKHTADDYRALPDTAPRYQLIGGQLVEMSPAPTFRHQAIVVELTYSFAGYARSHGGTALVAPIDVYLSEHDVLQPDVLWVSPERKPRVERDGIHGAPDVVVEVLSPSTRSHDLGAKRQLYAQHGVREYWVIDLESEELAVYRGETTQPAETYVPGQVFASQVMPGLQLELDTLFTSA